MNSRSIPQLAALVLALLDGSSSIARESIRVASSAPSCAKALEPRPTLITEIRNPNGALTREEMAAISREVEAINVIVRPRLQAPDSVSVLPRFTQRRNFSNSRVLILSYQYVIRPLVDPDASQADVFAARALLTHEYGHIVFKENSESVLYADNGFAADLEKYKLSWIDYLIEDAPLLRAEPWVKEQQGASRGFFYNDAYFLWQYSGAYEELFADLLVTLHTHDKSGMFSAMTHLYPDPKSSNYLLYLSFDVDHFVRPVVEDDLYAELARARTLIGKRHVKAGMLPEESSKLLESTLGASVPEILYRYRRTLVRPHLPPRDANERSLRLAEGIRERQSL